MIYCSSCGLANRDNSRFCNDCGQRLGEWVDCPSCRFPNLSTANFCNQCGGALRREKLAAPVDAPALPLQFPEEPPIEADAPTLPELLAQASSPQPPAPELVFTDSGYEGSDRIDALSDTALISTAFDERDDRPIAAETASPIAAPCTEIGHTAAESDETPLASLTPDEVVAPAASLFGQADSSPMAPSLLDAQIAPIPSFAEVTVASTTRLQLDDDAAQDVVALAGPSASLYESDLLSAPSAVSTASAIGVSGETGAGVTLEAPESRQPEPALDASIRPQGDPPIAEHLEARLGEALPRITDEPDQAQAASETCSRGSKVQCGIALSRSAQAALAGNVTNVPRVRAEDFTGAGSIFAQIAMGSDVAVQAKAAEPKRKSSPPKRMRLILVVAVILALIGVAALIAGIAPLRIALPNLEALGWP